MIRIAEGFPDRKIVTTLSALLGWNRFVEAAQWATTTSRAAGRTSARCGAMGGVAGQVFSGAMKMRGRLRVGGLSLR